MMVLSELDFLLLLDGERYFLDPQKRYWVKFEARRTEPNEHLPYGVKYSLTLHGPGNRRVLGYDNAHGIKPKKKKFGSRKHAWDHRHFNNIAEPYEFDSAETLLSDFWSDVETFLKEAGEK